MNADQIFSDWLKLWEPPKRLTLSQWAEQHFYTSAEYSGSTGRLRLHAYQREPLDCFTDPRVSDIIISSGTQMLKTLLMQVAFAYVAAEDPGPCLLSQYKETDVEQFSKERLAPMIRDIPKLQAIPSLSSKSRTSGSTTTYKEFPGGSWSLVGAGTAGNAARRSIRFYFGDEVNKYKLTREGPFTQLAAERTATFGTQAKRVYCCSPTTKEGLISRKYEESDQRKLWVSCPDCGNFQILKWSRVWWNPDLPREDQAASARYRCAFCPSHWDDVKRLTACECVKWVASKPFRGIAGFGALGHLYSPYKTLSGMTAEWLRITSEKSIDAQQDLMTFVNTNLAEDWEERGDAPEWQILLDRREDYPAGTVPNGGLFISVGADVHPDRIEAEAVAWGKDKQSWSIAYEIFNGRTSEPQVWAEFEAFTRRTFVHLASGSELPISRVFVDSGNDANNVYRWVRTQDPDRIVAIKGYDGGSLPVGQPSPVDVTVDGKKLVNGLRIKTVQVSFFKRDIYGDLRKRPPTEEELAAGAAFPAGYCHFPKNARNYGDEHFKQLCAEQIVTRKNVRTGRLQTEFATTRDRNEALDCRVYARAAAWDFGLDQAQEIHWQALEESLKPVTPSVASAPVPIVEDPAPNDHVGTSARRDPWSPAVREKKNWFKR